MREKRLSVPPLRSLSVSAPEIRAAAVQKTGVVAARLVRTVFLFCMSFVVLYPILYMISVSFRTPEDLYDPTVIWIPLHWTLQNYIDVVSIMNYPGLLANTLVQSIACTVLNVAVCALIGYGFARFRFPLRGLAFSLVLFTIIVPPQNISIPLYLQYQAFDFLGLGQIGRLFTAKAFTVNLLNTPLTMYIPAVLGMGIRSGLFIYIFRQFFRGMPKELEDAAYIDGCGIFRTFTRIMLSNAAPAILSCILFSFVWYWNDYFLSLMYFDEPQTLSTVLAGLQGTLRSMGFDFYSNPYLIVTRMQAACLLTIMPLIVLYAFLQRFFTDSIDKTGIVG